MSQGLEKSESRWLQESGGELGVVDELDGRRVGVGKFGIHVDCLWTGDSVQTARAVKSIRVHGGSAQQVGGAKALGIRVLRSAHSRCGCSVRVSREPRGSKRSQTPLPEGAPLPEVPDTSTGGAFDRLAPARPPPGSYRPGIFNYRYRRAPRDPNRKQPLSHQVGCRESGT